MAGCSRHEKYTIGIDFGTLSARAALFDVIEGKRVGECTFVYPHGVINNGLPGCAIADPDDYQTALTTLIPKLLDMTQIDPQNIIGLGLDCTSCSILPVTQERIPLSRMKEWKHNSDAYIRLWKHHTATRYANQYSELAKEMVPDHLKDVGGTISPAWMLPKLMQTFTETTEMTQTAYQYMEVGDWLVQWLTGTDIRSESAAGFVGSQTDGLLPPDHFMDQLAPGFSQYAKRMLKSTYIGVGEAAGQLLPERAAELGLMTETVVASANIDAQVAFPASGIHDEGTMLIILGTSTVYLMVNKKKYTVPGMGAVVKNGILPGYYGYSAGQSGLGDILDWYIHRAMPGYLMDEAQCQGLDIYTYLSKLAAGLRPGESGLLALDWWNGNRSVLKDMTLAGCIMGMTLNTKPEHIFRALVEASAFGAKKIVETYREYGIEVKNLCFTGGIPVKNPWLVQVYTDILGLPVSVVEDSVSAALGSAITAAAAAGANAGGYDTLAQAITAMAVKEKKCYSPNPEHVMMYDELYREYKRLHDYMGYGNESIMKQLRKIKDRVSRS